MKISEEQIRAAAEATLKHWPAASAVLLFGSRARGDHRPSSDWDLAVVTDDPHHRPPDLPLLDLVELEPCSIDVAYISDADIRRQRNLLGRLGCALAREAKPIAGSWRPPSELKEPELDHAMYGTEIRNSLRRFGEALISAESVFRRSSAMATQDSANSFVNSSADAAEHLAKAVLVRNGHQPRSIHDLGRLADDLAGQDPALAETIRSLNGHTQADHTRHYANAPPATAEVVEHSVQRLQRTGRLLAAELPHWRNVDVEFEMGRIKSNTADLGDARPLAPDEAGPGAGQADLALRAGGDAVLKGARALWTAWREAHPEPTADDGPSP